MAERLWRGSVCREERALSATILAPLSSTVKVAEALCDPNLAGIGRARGRNPPKLCDKIEIRRFPMATIDWSLCSAVESVPGKLSEAWVFRGTRMPVATVFENLDAGATIDEIMEWFDVTSEQVTSVLDFARLTNAVQ